MTLAFLCFLQAQAFISVIPGRTFWRVATVSIGPLLLTSGISGQNPVDSTLARFVGTDPRTFTLDLEQRRPRAVTRDFMKRILDSLPAKGEVKKLKPAAQRKLTSLEQVLSLHQRQLVYEIKVISVPQAFVGLHARAVVLISETALKLLEAEELQAQVAHEIGHEYVWAEYETARDLNDLRGLQELELYCDGVAILTLVKAGVGPSRLVTGLEKMGRFNRQQLGRALNEDHYPSLAERKKFAQAITAWATTSSAGPIGRASNGIATPQ